MQKSYQLKLEFKNRAKNSCIFALPQTNQYQEIKELSVRPKPADLVFDEWGNTVAVFSEKTTLEFLYDSKNITKSIDTNWVLGDYKKNKQILFFSKSNRFINGKDTKITKLAKALINKEQNVFKITKSFYDFVLEYLSYGKPTEGLYPYSQALEEKTTDCGGFSTLLLSLFQSIGILGRLVVGFLLKKNPTKELLSTFHVSRYTFHDFIMHAWPEILLPDDTWFPMDPSIEWRRKHGLTKRNGGFGEIPSDRLVVSFGCDHTIKINNRNYEIDIFQHPFYV